MSIIATVRKNGVMDFHCREYEDDITLLWWHEHDCKVILPKELLLDQPDEIRNKKIPHVL